MQEILVGYENGKSCNLEKSVVLKDALYDLPEVTALLFEIIL